MEIQLPKKLEPLILNPHTHNKIEGGRGGAKSRSVVSLFIEVMRLAPIRILCGRETQKSLEESSFSEFTSEIYRRDLGNFFHAKEGKIRGPNGSVATFIGLKQHTAESIKGYSDYHWFWGEEAQSISAASLKVVIPTLRTDGWFEIDSGGTVLQFPLRMFVYTLNPYTYDDATEIVIPDSRSDTQKIEVNYWDNPWFPESLEMERQEAEKTMAPEEYARIWEGIRYENTENAIITRAKANEATKRTVADTGGIVVGADIARFGSDRTVFFKRKGLRVIDYKIYHGKDTQEVADLLKDFAQGGVIFVDDTGVGGGVTDRLKRLGQRVVPINFGAKAADKNKYPDIISEMWFNLAGLIDKISIPKIPDLITELCTRAYKYTADERRKVESKDEYKRRTGRRSPDLADALILCFYNRQNRGQMLNIQM